MNPCICPPWFPSNWKPKNHCHLYDKDGIYLAEAIEVKTIQEVSKLVFKNPTDTAIRQIIAMSEHRAAKWLKNKDTGDIYYWPAEEAQHAEIAKLMQVTNWEKGVAIDE
jgi:hypothetical protein